MGAAAVVVEGVELVVLGFAAGIVAGDEDAEVGMAEVGAIVAIGMRGAVEEIAGQLTGGNTAADGKGGAVLGTGGLADVLGGEALAEGVALAVIGFAVAGGGGAGGLGLDAGGLTPDTFAATPDTFAATPDNPRPAGSRIIRPGGT